MLKIKRNSYLAKSNLNKNLINKVEIIYFSPDGGLKNNVLLPANLVKRLKIGG